MQHRSSTSWQYRRLVLKPASNHRIYGKKKRRLVYLVFYAKLKLTLALSSTVKLARITKKITQSLVHKQQLGSPYQTSLSTIVPRRAFDPPITAPLPYTLLLSTRTGMRKRGKEKEKERQRRTLELDQSNALDRLKYNLFRLINILRMLLHKTVVYPSDYTVLTKTSTPVPCWIGKPVTWRQS